MTTLHAQITFVIAARNAESTLPDTLRSLICQSRPDWRAVVVDDHSADQTPRIANSTGDPRIAVIESPGRGVAAARNAGFALATTPLVAFPDADDVLDPHFHACLQAALGGHDAVACGCRFLGPGLVRGGWEAIPPPGSSQLESLAQENPFALGAVVSRIDALRRLAHPAGGSSPVPRLFDERTHLEDWDLLLRLSGSGASWAPIVPEPLYGYRLLPNSRTANLRPWWEDGLRLIRRYHPLPRGADDAARHWTLRALARAAVLGHHALAAELLGWLGGLDQSDQGMLTSAVRAAVRRARLSGDPAARVDRATWRLAVARAMGATPLAHAAVSRAFATSDGWSAVADWALTRVPRGGTLVIYGMGQNGREFLAALPRGRVPLACVDDNPSAHTDLPRLDSDDLGPQHTVLVTPDSRERIVWMPWVARVGAVLFPENATDAESAAPAA